MPFSPASTSDLPQASFDALRGAVGLAIGHASGPLMESVELAAEAERRGLDLVSIPDSGAETFSMLGAIAARTERIGLWSGIAQWTRTPVTAAHAAKTIQNLSGGRYGLGIGPMPRHYAEQWHGIDYAPVVARMRDYITATRAAMVATAEAPTAHEGEFFRTVGYPGAPMVPEQPVPIQLAASQPRMTALAAEVGDGIMLNTIQPTGWLTDVGADAIAEGLARSGRPRERFSIGILKLCGVDDDRAVAYDHVRRSISFYFSIPYFRTLLEPYGFGDELDAGEAALAAGDSEAQVAAVSDELVDAVALAGTPDEVVAKLRALQEHVDYVVVGGVIGLDREAARSQTLRLIDTFGPVAKSGAALSDRLTARSAPVSQESS